jgi:hypothetical protein
MGRAVPEANPSARPKRSWLWRVLTLVKQRI